MDEKIAHKIRSLLRQAENTPYEHEAETFLRKAQELMITYSIDEERLWANDPSRRKKIEVIKIKVPDNKPGAMQKRIILSEIARLNSCKMWYTPGKGVSSVAGYPNDLLFVEMLFTSIMTQMNFKLAFAQANADGANARTFRTNFAIAYSDRITVRLRELYRQASVNVTGTGTTALALVDRRQQVEKWARENLQLGSSSYQSSARYDSRAQAAGRYAADQTDISGGRGKVGSGRKGLNA